MKAQTPTLSPPGSPKAFALSSFPESSRDLVRSFVHHDRDGGTITAAELSSAIKGRSTELSAQKLCNKRLGTSLAGLLVLLTAVLAILGGVVFYVCRATTTLTVAKDNVIVSATGARRDQLVHVASFAVEAVVALSPSSSIAELDALRSVSISSPITGAALRIKVEGWGIAAVGSAARAVYLQTAAGLVQVTDSGSLALVAPGDVAAVNAALWAAARDGAVAQGVLSNTSSLCAADTFSATGSGPECKACSKDFTSSAGATQCVAKVPLVAGARRSRARMLATQYPGVCYSSQGPAPSPLPLAITVVARKYFTTVATTLPVTQQLLRTDGSLNIPPRLMWGWGDLWSNPSVSLSGYCGETSFAQGLMFFGSYVSSERVRYASSSELLIGDNDVIAAANLRLKYVSYAGGTPAAFAVWAQTQIAAKSMPIASVFTADIGASPEYDHIVPIINATGGLFFHDLANQFARRLPSGGYTRAGCDAAFAAPADVDNFLLFENCLPSPVVYASAITGNLDTASETVRMSVSFTAPQTNIPGFEPDWSFENKCYYPAVRFNLTARIYGLGAATVKYAILRFDNPATVPSVRAN